MIGKATVRRIALGVTTALAFGALAACQSSEEKAEGHYQAGLALLQAGDSDRALVEFRNVFKLNGEHREARRTYARVQRAAGNLREAYGQYLRLVEQYPEDAEGNLALAEMALPNGAWDDAGKYAAAALAADAGSVAAQAVLLVVDYRTKLQARDEAAVAALITQAEGLLQANPGVALLRKLLADERMRQTDYAGALALIDEGLALDPDLEDFYTVRLAVLYQLGETDAITDHLKAMIARKPGDAQTRNTLIAWYMSQNDLEAAEAAIRAEIDPAEDALDPRMRLLLFLTQVKGPDAARTEIDAFLAATPGSPHVAVFRAMLAGFDFEAGKREDAITAMQQIIADHPEAAQINTLRISLAQMMSTTGNEVGARALIEEVLAAEPVNAEALKVKAAWLIEDDQTGDALVALRTALEQDARDAGALTLMARAHERDGSTDLMGEMLALAVEASGQAPDTSLRYAGFLQSQGKQLPAEDTLINALRREPGNVALLGALGGLYLQMKDWGRAEGVVRTLEGGKTEQSRRVGQELLARLLAASGREQELTQFLESLSDKDVGPAAEMALVRDVVQRGDYAQALAQVADLESRYPDLPQVGLLHALVLSTADRAPEAITRLEALIAAHPGFEQGWLALYNIATAQGDAAKAEATLAAGLAALPESRTLLWVKAGAVERSGDVDGAIAIYEALYAKDSNWAVVANNLASLLANSRDDAESLERAYVIARRLRNSTEPAFQDTYGWVAFRRGNLDEALAHLEPAAAGLPLDMTVQYHLAMVYGALNRRDEALAILEKVDSAVPPPPPAVLEAVRAEIARLKAAPATDSN